MKENGKSKEQLIEELAEARRLLADCEQTRTARTEGVKPRQLSINEERLRQVVKERERLEERYRAFIEQSAEGIWLIETEAPISTAISEDEQINAYFHATYLAECNNAMARMYGFSSPSELVGIKLGDLLPPTDPYNIEFLRAFIRSDYRLTDVESHEVDKDGNRKYFLNTFSGDIKDGFLHRAWGTQRDITSQKLLAIQLKEMNEKLALEVEERKQVGFELLKSQVNIQTLLDAIPDSLFRIHRDGTYLAYKGINSETLLNPNEFVGKTVYEILPKEVAEQTLANLNQALESDQLQRFEYELPAQAGTQWYEARLIANGLDEVLAIVRDITESKSAEEDLRASEERYRDLYENNPHLVFTVAADGTILSVNEFGARQLGYSVKELVGLSVLILFHDADRPAMVRRLAECIELGSQVSQWEIRKIRKDGQTIWAKETARVIKIRNNAPAVLIVCEDITWRKHADDALRESEEKFSKAVNLSPHAISIISLKDGRYLYLNEIALAATGYRREEIIGRTILEVEMWATAEEREKTRRLFFQNPSIRDLELKVKNRAGEISYALISSEPITIGGEPCLLITGNNITERVKYEKALKESEERFQSLANNSPTGIYRLNNEGRFVYVNDRWCEIVGLEKEQGLDFGWRNAIHPDDFKEILAKASAAATKGANFREEYRVRRPDGAVVWVYNQAGPERNAQGEILGYVGTLTDITERKIAEEAIKESEARFHNLAKSSPAGIFRSDFEGRCLYVNERWCEITGLSRAEALGLGWTQIVHPADRERIYKVALRASKKGLEMKEEHRFQRPDGSIVWVYGQAVPERNAEGEMVGFVGTITDITEHKMAEEALRASEERYRLLFERNLAGVYRATLSGRVIDVNEAYAQIFGYQSGAEILTHNAFDFFFDRAERDEYIAQLRQHGHLNNHELRARKKDGTPVWVLINATLVKGDSDDTTYLEETLFDITHRKQAEEALRESEARFRVVAETSPGSILLYDREHFVYVNPATTAITGYTKEELLNMGPFDLIDAGEEEIANRRWEERLQGAKVASNYEYKIHTKSGEECWIAFNPGDFITYQGKQVATATAFDITERKRAENALRDSEAKFRSVAETSPCAIAIARDNLFVYVNPALEKITGYSSEELLNGNSLDLLLPQDQKIARERQTARSRGEQIPNTGEYKIITKSGDERWIEFTSGGEINYQGKRATIGTAFDITTRKQAEEMLAAEKERLVVTLRSIGDGVIATDTEGRIVLLNRIAENLTGWKQEDAIGRPLPEVFHILNEKTRQRSENPVEKVLRTGQSVTLANHTALIAKDSSERPIADSGAPIYDRESKIIGVVLVFRDMTEELQREAELLRAGKLESIGLLAGGIAHDFNNILTAILGNVSLAKRYISEDHTAYRRLNETEQATMRARDLTQQLLTFARGGAPIKRTISVANLLREAVPFALTGSNIQNALQIQDRLWFSEIDEGQINQVIHNLVLNARQAMPVGGVLVVQAENVSFAAGTKIQGARLPAGRYVKITVKDSGVGIPEEYITKIFDPYFTTKQKGSGLGLATSYSIIKNHGGFIFVESKLGAGTTFEVYLPASEKETLEQAEIEENSLSGKGKILVMDDEEVIRDMVADMLSYLGYEAGAAKNGDEAISLYREALQAGKPFDAVIMDLTIPGGMGGEEAVKRLLQLDPQARCIVSSGYSTAPVMADYKKYGFVAVITKPFQIVQLNDLLHRLLQEDTGDRI